MRLPELQRVAVELCYGAEPSPEACAVLGDERIWRIYRDAVRKRLRGELEVALPRTRAALGEATFSGLFDRFLLQAPPRTRFFHAVVGCFAEAALPWMRAQPEVAAHVADLCRYEAARWKVGDASDDPAQPALEFNFDRVPILSPAVELLELQHAVQLEPGASGGYAPGEVLLCVYRSREQTKARYFVLNAVTYALMQRFQQQSESVAQSVQHVAQVRELALDQTFLDGLCTVLADFLERGILLGGREAA